MANPSLAGKFKDLIEEDSTVRGAAGIAIGTAIGDLLSMSVPVVSSLAQKPAIMADKVVRTPVLDKLMRNAKHNLKAEVVIKKGIGHEYRQANADFIHQIRAPKGVTPHTLAHEMGHATPKGRILKGKALELAYQFGSISPIIASIAGALAASKMLIDEDPEGAKRIAEVGAGLSVAGAAPLLYEEGRASLHGVKHLRRAGMSVKNIIRKAGPLAVQQLSYPAMALLPALGLYLGSKYIKGNKDA